MANLNLSKPQRSASAGAWVLTARIVGAILAIHRATDQLNHEELKMQINIDAQPYTLCIDCPGTLADGATVVRLPDGIEASCNEVNGLWMILEALGGRKWWQCHRPDIIQQVLDTTR